MCIVQTINAHFETTAHYQAKDGHLLPSFRAMWVPNEVTQFVPLAMGTQLGI